MKKYIFLDIDGVTAEVIWAKDKKKQEIAKLKGFRVFALWEKEIKACSSQELLDYIEGEINATNSIHQG